MVLHCKFKSSIKGLIASWDSSRVTLVHFVKA